MTPDIIIVNTDIRYRNRLKEYLEGNGLNNIRASDTLSSVDTDCDSCNGRLIVASGKNLRYSDLLLASRGVGEDSVCQKARYILLYDSRSGVRADYGLAKCAHCIVDAENFGYILDVVKEEISDYFSAKKKERGENELVFDMLDGLGFNPTHKGYGYLVCTARMTDVEMITKDVYPSIARKYKTTSSSVERGIRSAVSYAWAHGGYARFNKQIDWSSTKRPTNGEFIRALALRLRLESMKNGAYMV